MIRLKIALFILLLMNILLIIKDSRRSIENVDYTDIDISTLFEINENLSSQTVGLMVILNSDRCQICNIREATYLNSIYEIYYRYINVYYSRNSSIETLKRLVVNLTHIN